jgi:hypothetical protein
MRGGFHRRQDSSGSNNLSSFYTLNYLEESMSYLEKTAKKLLPIMTHLKRRMVPEKTVKDINTAPSVVKKIKGKIETLESFRENEANSDMDD